MMKLFIWQYVDHVSSRYHDGGGLVVAALSLDEARKKVQDALPECGALKDEPDHVVDIVSAESDMFLVFPNAGCC